MHPRFAPRRLRPLACLLACAAAGALLSIGCASKPKKITLPPVRYVNRGPKPGLPAYMAGSFMERADLANTDGFAVSSFGLVGGLRHTGSSVAPTPVRQWMIREMLKHGLASGLPIPGLQGMGPEDMLRDDRFAIVRVDGSIPPGARKDDWFDVRVSALPYKENTTSSLSRGVLFETDLKDNGANAMNPGVAVTVLARTKGSIMVNPAYALLSGEPTGAARASLRHGVILYSGRVMQDRPLLLELREPQFSTARRIEERINERFQGQLDLLSKQNNGTRMIAEALDEGVVQVFVPKAFNGDWEHFSGIVMHLFLDNRGAQGVEKARQLATEAVKPDAALQDISYCWEGIGAPAMPYVAPLLTDPRPEVSFAAARAAAFIGDPSGAAEVTLARIARTPDHPFRISAVRVLGALPASAALNHLLRDLLNDDATAVRIEAYKVLANNKDSSVVTRFLRRDQGQFALDIVPSSGPPIIYGSRRGAPRIAIIGRTPALTLPITYTTMGGSLMIASSSTDANVTIYHRDDAGDPVKMLSRPDLPEIVARLGGDGAPTEARFDFTYGEVLAILQGLSSSHRIAAHGPNREQVAAAFILQESAVKEEVLRNAPAIDGGRPQTENKGPIGQEPAESGTNPPEVSSGR